MQVSARAARHLGLGRWLQGEMPRAARGQRDPGGRDACLTGCRWEGPSH